MFETSVDVSFELWDALACGKFTCVWAAQGVWKKGFGGRLSRGYLQFASYSKSGDKVVSSENLPKVLDVIIVFAMAYQIEGNGMRAYSINQAINAEAHSITIYIFKWNALFFLTTFEISLDSSSPKLVLYNAPNLRRFGLIVIF